MDKKKKIIFPLEMEAGEKVYTLDELRDNFSVFRVQHYFLNGRLEVWLRDRHIDMLAEQIGNVSREDERAMEKVCEILGVELDEVILADIEKLKNGEADTDENMEEMQETQELKDEITEQEEDVATDFGVTDSVFFWDYNGVYLEEPDNIKKVLCHPVHNYERGAGIATEGNYVYVKSQMGPHSKQYAIKKYDIRDSSTEIICTLTEKETDRGEKKNCYSILGKKNNTLYLYDEWEKYDLTIYTINLMSGEIEVHKIEKTGTFSDYQLNSILINDAGTKMYCLRKGYDSKYRLAEIDLEKNRSKRISDDQMNSDDFLDGGLYGSSFSRVSDYVLGLQGGNGSGLQLNRGNFGSNKGILVWNNEKCYFYDLKAESLKYIQPIKMSNSYGEHVVDMCYYKEKIYWIVEYYNIKSPFFRTQGGGKWTIKEYDFSTGQVAEVKVFQFNQLPKGTAGMGGVTTMHSIRIMRDTLYMSAGDFVTDEFMPQYRIKIGIWSLEELVKEGDTMFWREVQA